MSKKSRRARTKKRNVGQLARTMQSERSQASRPVSVLKISTPPIGSSLSAAKAAQHQYVVSELSRIGIIAGALFVILVMLTFVLG